MRKMRRSDKQLSNDEALEVLKTGEYGILSMVNEEGKAYGVPLSYALSGDKIYFHCAKEGYKLDNIRNNENVCFTVVGMTKLLPEKFDTLYKSVIVFGRAEIVREEEKVEGLREIIKKYSPGFMEKGEEYIQRAKNAIEIVRIDIESLTGKHEG